MVAEAPGCCPASDKGISRHGGTSSHWKEVSCLVQQWASDRTFFTTVERSLSTAPDKFALLKPNHEIACTRPLPSFQQLVVFALSDSKGDHISSSCTMRDMYQYIPHETCFMLLTYKSRDLSRKCIHAWKYTMWCTQLQTLIGPVGSVCLQRDTPTQKICVVLFVLYYWVYHINSWWLLCNQIRITNNHDDVHEP